MAGLALDAVCPECGHEGGSQYRRMPPLGIWLHRRQVRVISGALLSLAALVGTMPVFIGTVLLLEIAGVEKVASIFGPASAGVVLQAIIAAGYLGLLSFFFSYAKNVALRRGAPRFASITTWAAGAAMSVWLICRSAGLETLIDGDWSPMITTSCAGLLIVHVCGMLWIARRVLSHCRRGSFLNLRMVTAGIIGLATVSCLPALFDWIDRLPPTAVTNGGYARQAIFYQIGALGLIFVYVGLYNGIRRESREVILLPS